MKNKNIVFATGLLVVVIGQALAGGNLPTKFLNKDSIANTRHNLTQRQAAGGGPSGVNMDPYRNDYQEVCVYCHTPHGSSTGVAGPLWNRTVKATEYTTYNAGGITTTQPGVSSIACLSCHDGQTAVDSIINMPGSGRYLASQAVSTSEDFLNSWNNARGPDATVHIGLNPVTANGCLVCHSPTGSIVGAGAPDFTMFVIGTNLANDHPVGVRYPASGQDFKAPTATRGRVTFFDTNGNGFDAKDVRLYDSGDGPEVECASCHDPHGVPSGGPGSTFLPTFLRVTPAGSVICLTCHNK